MGLFLSMSSVVGAKRAEIEACVAAYAEEHCGLLRIEDVKDPQDEAARLLESRAGATFVYPDDFSEGDEVSAKLSVELQRPVFWFHIHDGDFWMFVLYLNGEEVLKFNPVPEYWQELDADERAEFLPSAEQVAQYVPGARSERLAPYLVEWPLDGLIGKAHPEDEFEFSEWQVVDFMRELGFDYPEPGRGVTYQFKVKGR